MGGWGAAPFRLSRIPEIGLLAHRICVEHFPRGRLLGVTRVKGLLDQTISHTYGVRIQISGPVGSL